MKQRAITSLFIVAVYVGVIASVILDFGAIFDAFIVILMISASLEMSRAVSKKYAKANEGVAIAAILIGYVAFYLVNYFLQETYFALMVFFAVIIVFALINVLFVLFSSKMQKESIITTTLVLVYPVALMVFMLGLNYIGKTHYTSNGFNIAAVLLMFIVPTFTDTAAYLSGSFFKGPKLCPQISPNKTISGAIGGLIGGILAGLLVWCFSHYGIFYVTKITDNFAMNLVHFIILGLVGSMFSQFGDLGASYIKRQCDVKDFGKIMPGHGGILDRIDGMMVACMFFYVYFSVIAI